MFTLDCMNYSDDCITVTGFRQDVLIKYSNTVGAELIEINDERQRLSASLSYEFN